jgi:FkbM family methyltransferase
MTHSISELRTLLACVLDHPANRHHRARAFFRFSWWQLRKRLSRNPAIVRVGKNRRFKVVTDSPFSSVVVYSGLPEWDEMRFLQRVLRPTDGFLDIGANVGFYTVLASTIVTQGPLLAFEANPRNQSVLREQVKLNQLANVEVFAVALGNSTGELSFFNSGRDGGSIACESDPSTNRITVPCSRLDDCLSGRHLPDYVVAKMDVEGCEALILEGAAETMQSGRIAVWLFELNDLALRKHGASGEKLLDLFAKHGYAIHYWNEENQRLGKRGDGDDSDRANYLACRDIGFIERRIYDTTATHD